jgi:PAS domain S-box-containing protein
MLEREIYALLENTADGAFAVAQNGIIRFWSRSAERLLGFTRSEVLNCHCSAVLEGCDAAGSPLCVPDCPVMRLAERGELIPSYDLDVRTAQGRRWINVSIITAHTANGEQSLIHLIRDIDVRKQQERIMQAILVQLKALTESGMAPRDEPPLDLTDQEARVLHLLAGGQTTPAIARDLGVTSATVRNHVQHVLHKLSAHSRLQAVVRAAKQGLL